MCFNPIVEGFISKFYSHSWRVYPLSVVYAPLCLLCVFCLSVRACVCEYRRALCVACMGMTSCVCCTCGILYYDKAIFLCVRCEWHWYCCLNTCRYLVIACAENLCIWQPSSNTEQDLLYRSTLDQGEREGGREGGEGL